MKIITLLCVCVLSAFTLLSQSVRIETANIGSKEIYSNGISRILDNKVYAFAIDGKKAVITGFDAVTMKQTVTFTTEAISRMYTLPVVFMDKQIMILHGEKGNDKALLADVYSYDGKAVSKDKVLHTFIGQERINSPIDVLSENGKYFAVAQDQENTVEYVVYGSDLKIISKGVLKVNLTVDEIMVSNNGTLGLLVHDADEKMNMTLLRILPGAKNSVTVKTLSKEYQPFMSMLIMNSGAYYLGGIYGTSQERKILRLSGTQIEETVIGAFGLKLNPENFDIIYENLTEFSAEQANMYNKEYEKYPGRGDNFEKYGFSRDRIYNFGYNYGSSLLMDGMAVDKDNQIVMSLSCYEPMDPVDKTSVSMILCQFKMGTSTGITNFTTFAKRQQMYGMGEAEKYFYSSLVCSGSTIVSVFNDDEGNINNLDNMTKGITKLGKDALLASAEVKPDGSRKKFILLPADKDVLIITKCTVFIDSKLSFAIGTRDKGEVVLIKISSKE
jgi:hypothetical protein